MVAAEVEGIRSLRYDGLFGVTRNTSQSSVDPEGAPGTVDEPGMCGQSRRSGAAGFDTADADHN
jgi:hypothetical protein